jgi:outer membrane protein assembly factor BamA
LWSQETSIQVQLKYDESRVDLPKLKIQENYNNILEVNQDLYQLLIDLRRQGYLEVSIDSLIKLDSSKYEAPLYLGQKYEWFYLNSGNLDAEVIAKVNFKPFKYDGNPFNFYEINQQLNEIVAYYENKGYPFAQARLDSMSIQDGQIFSSIFVEPNERIIIDSIIVHGNTNTKPVFLQNYLQIFAGDPFQQKKIDNIEKRLRQLPYLSMTQKPEVIFKPGEATIHIYLQKQRSNQFNFIIGVLPNSELQNRNLTITGDGILHLQNSFGVGEEIFAEFKQIRPQTQNLSLKFLYPYLLNLPLGVTGAFELYKNDSLFVNLDAELGILYQLGGMNHFKAFYHNTTSNVLNYDTASIRRTEELPEVLDVRNNSYGLALNFQNLDYVLNPRKGFHFNFSASVGSKVIRKSPSIASLSDDSGSSLESLYEDIDLRSLTYQLQFRAKYFVPVKRRSTFLVQNYTKAFIAKNVFVNEKYRIGGSKLMRGFDEESIFTPFFSISTIEYRFLLSQNSYFNTFVDIGVVEDTRFGAGSIDVPIGFGTGLALETKGGIFSLAYALGKQLDNKIEFKNGKIHFGYVNIF